MSDEQIFQEMKTLLDEETSNKIQRLLSDQNKNLSFVDTKVKKSMLHSFFLKKDF